MIARDEVCKSPTQFASLACFFTFLSWRLGHNFFQQTHEHLTLLLLLLQEKHLKIFLLLFLPVLLFCHHPQYILVLLLVLSLLIYKHLMLGGFVFLLLLLQFNFFLPDFSLILELLLQDLHSFSSASSAFSLTNFITTCISIPLPGLSQALHGF